MPDDRHPVYHDHFACDRTLDVAALLDREIDDHRPRLHAYDLRRRDQPRCRTSRDQRGGDDDVLLGDMPRHELGLRRLVFGRHLAGISTRPLAFDPGDVLDEDRLRAQGLDLLAGRRAHVRRRHLSPEPPRGRDRLEAGDTDAHHEGFRRADRPRRGHHHRKRATIFGGGIEHRLVPRQVRLRRKDVHRLRTRDARHELHRQGFVAGRGIGLDPRTFRKGIEAGDDPRPGRHASQHRRVRPLHAEHDTRPL